MTTEDAKGEQEPEEEWTFGSCVGCGVLSSGPPGKAICSECAAIERVRALTSTLVEAGEALRAYVLAQSRMRDRWAESDEAVCRQLWRELHECEDAARALLARIAKEVGK